MPAMTRNEASNPSNPKLDVFMKDDSQVPINVSSLAFQIFEKVSSPGVPTQVYPSSGRQAVNLSAQPAGDRIETGHYVARYTVPTNALIGTWEIRWFAKYLPSSPEQSFTEEFEVISAPSISASDTYISVADVRAAGVNMNPPDDATIFASILLWQQTLERVTRQWFRPVAAEFRLDGNGSDTLHLPVPIISVETLKVNYCEDALETDKYYVYNGRLLPDDRKNPRIKLVDSFGFQRDIFTAPDRTGRSRFHTGQQNQYVKGVFGYIEPDGSTPMLIKRALMKLVIKSLQSPLLGSPPAGLSPPSITTGLVKEEWTDGHQIEYQVSGGEIKPRSIGLGGLIDDPEVQMIIKLYKAPLGIGAPANPTWI